MTHFELVISMTEANDSSNHLPGCSRRDAIRQLLSMGAVASAAQTALDAQVPPTLGRLDLHHHFYATTPLMKKFTADLPYPGPIFAYTAARSLEAMDQADVSTAMLSCPMTFGDDPAAARQDARVFAREMNEYGAKLVSDHRGRFGLFAMLPLPDIDASLREIEYACDTLGADGVGLATSYGGQWLGDDGFDAVFRELNRRRAVVFSHPHDAPCCHNLLPNTGPQAVEWNTDTSRAIWNLINDGTDAKSGLSLVAGDRVSSVPSKATRYGNIRFIWSHAGGSSNSDAGPEVPGGHISNCFGSDFPFAPPLNTVEGLRDAGLSAEELRAIERENALRVLSRKA